MLKAVAQLLHKEWFWYLVIISYARNLTRGR